MAAVLKRSALAWSQCSPCAAQVCVQPRKSGAKYQPFGMGGGAGEGGGGEGGGGEGRGGGGEGSGEGGEG